jgi:hypothetical protein
MPKRYMVRRLVAMPMPGPTALNAVSDLRYVILFGKFVGHHSLIRIWGESSNLICLIKSIPCSMSSKLGFSEWPFHTLPDEDFIKVWCARKELQKKLDRIFTRLLQRPAFQICLLYGEFGAGKTHSIRHMLNKYREKAKLLTSELEYDVTIRTFTHLYQAITSRFDFDTISDWPNPPATGSWSDFDSFLKGMQLGDQDQKSTCMRWLTGEERSKRALSGVNIRSPITDIDTAVRAFSELTKLAGRNKSAVVLFIDEFQHVGKLNENWRENILNGLTKLVNSSPNHFSLIISFRLRMPKNILSIIPESLVSRFSGDPFIEVSNFSRDEAEEFVRCIFGKFRISAVDAPYFPFTPQAVDTILEFLKERHVDYNPRSLMKAFGHVSESFENSDQEVPVSAEFAKNSLTSYLA